MKGLPEEPSLDDWRKTYRSLQLLNAFGCLREDQMIAMAKKEIWGVDRLALADHIVQCRQCTDAYQSLLRLLF